MNSYLITFATTTDAFTADRHLKSSPRDILGADTSITAIPYELSKTCYGLGIEFTSDEATAQKIASDLRNGNKPFKFLWERKDGEKEYTKVGEGSQA